MNQQHIIVICILVVVFTFLIVYFFKVVNKPTKYFGEIDDGNLESDSFKSDKTNLFEKSSANRGEFGCSSPIQQDPFYMNKNFINFGISFVGLIVIIFILDNTNGSWVL